MTEIRPDASRRDDSVTPQVHDDLRALRESTARHIPELDHSVSAIRSRRRGATQLWKERLMPITDSFKQRPWLAGSALAAALVVALLVVPISYERTAGHDVALTLAGMSDMSRVRDIAGEFKSVLGVDHVAVKAEMGAAGPSITLEGYVPAASGVNAAARAQALAKELGQRGFTATSIATPRKERVAGSVYAYARDLVIRVDTDGKSAAQIEAEIRQRLADAGITNTTVSVTDSGNERKVTIKAENHGEPGATPEPGTIGLELTKNGQTLGGDGVRVEMKRLKTPEGLTLHADVTDHGRTAAIDIPHADTMSDAALAAEMESKLDAAGMNLHVTVVNGQVEIEARK